MTATWTAPATYVDGVLIDAADLNLVRDNLEWLKGHPYGTEQDFDGTVYSSSSTSFADTGITSGSLTTTGGRVAVACFGTFGGAIGNNVVAALTLYEDGVNMGDATLGMTAQSSYSSGTTHRKPFGMFYITPTAPSAGAHEWKLYAKTSADTLVLYAAFIAAFELGV